MINEPELRALLNDLESDRIERTTSTADTNKFCEAICAFANDMPQNNLPGYLVIGARNDGKIAGAEVTDDLLKQLSNYADSGQIVPLPSMTVQKMALTEGDVAIVEVRPSDMPPVRYRGRVWIRRGPRKAIANEQDERILTEKRTHRARTFDLRPCSGCGRDELVLDLFQLTYRNAAVAPELIEENNRELPLQMASLGFWCVAESCATNAGAILFAQDPANWFPGAAIQYVQYEGAALDTDVLDERRFTGDLITVLHELDAFVKTLFPSQPESVSALKEKNRTPYPMPAIRELLMNAVMHRDYESNAAIRFYRFSDHIEIQNTGGLYGAVTPDTSPESERLPEPKNCRSHEDAGICEYLWAWHCARPADAPRKRKPARGIRYSSTRVLPGHSPRGRVMKTIAFFNNKGGVGKTTLVYHIAWMAAELGKRVLAIDLDPQANLTTMFLNEDALEKLWPEEGGNKSILTCISPIIEGLGDIAEAPLQKIRPEIHLLPGDLGLSQFEDKLSDSWPRCLDGDKAAFRVITAFYRIIYRAAETVNADITLMDIGPNLGAINRAALIASDFIVMPLARRTLLSTGAEKFGANAIHLARKLAATVTRKAGQFGHSNAAGGAMQPAGYVVMQHVERKNRPVKAYQRWVSKIPSVYEKDVLRHEILQENTETDANRIGFIKNYQSLMPMAEDARKPIFKLTPADGAIGSHAAAVSKCYMDFKTLTQEVIHRTGGDE